MGGIAENVNRGSLTGFAHTDGVDISHGAATGLTQAGPITIEGWFRLDSFPTSGQGAMLVGKGWPYVAVDNEYFLRYDNDAGGKRFALVLSDGTTIAEAYGLYDVTLGDWFHVAATFDNALGGDFSDKCRIYVDGVSLSLTDDGNNITAINTSPSSPDVFRVGNWSTTGDYNPIDGYADEIRFWSVARTASEVADNRATVLTGTESGLELYWRFDEDVDSTTAVDETANGNDGTIDGLVYATKVPFSAAPKVKAIAASDPPGGVGLVG